jgi:hypothetical protein
VQLKAKEAEHAKALQAAEAKQARALQAAEALSKHAEASVKKLKEDHSARQVKLEAAHAEALQQQREAVEQEYAVRILIFDLQWFLASAPRSSAAAGAMARPSPLGSGMVQSASHTEALEQKTVVLLPFELRCALPCLLPSPRGVAAGKKGILCPVPLPSTQS